MITRCHDKRNLEELDKTRPITEHFRAVMRHISGDETKIRVQAVHGANRPLEPLEVESIRLRSSSLTTAETKLRIATVHNADDAWRLLRDRLRITTPRAYGSSRSKQKAPSVTRIIHLIRSLCHPGPRRRSLHFVLK